jgi:NO-binding membrane sensor protein with MHYT domain
LTAVAAAAGICSGAGIAATMRSNGMAAAAAMPRLVSVGQWFSVSLTVTNTGGSAVNGVTPTLAVGPGGTLVTFATGPTPAGPRRNGTGSPLRP